MNLKKQQIRDVFINLKQLKGNGIWFDGEKDKGEYKEWWSNGQLYIHCFFNGKNGYKDKYKGVYKEWGGNGKLERHIIFNNDGSLKETIV